MANPEEPSVNLTPESTVTLVIEGEPTTCRIREKDSFDFDGPEVKFVIKTQPSIVKFAEGGEVISTSREGMTLTAKPGQAIITNINENGQTEDSYIFGNPDDSVEVQLEQFNNKYSLHTPKPGDLQLVLNRGEILYHKRVEVLKAIMVSEPTAIHQSWNAEGTLMGVLPGGLVTQNGYTIHPHSLQGFYRLVEPDSLTQYLSGEINYP